MAQKKTIDDAKVLEKALLTISALGPDNFTLADVGQSVGLAPATLLQRFGSKQQLLIRAALHAQAQLKSELETLKNKNLPWDEELILLLAGIPEGFGSRQEIANSLGLLKLDMVDPKLHPIARKLFELLRRRIQELLLKGQSEGKLETSIDVAEMTWELDALRHGLVIQWTLSGDDSLQNWVRNGFNRYLQRTQK